MPNPLKTITIITLCLLLTACTPPQTNKPRQAQSPANRLPYPPPTPQATPPYPPPNLTISNTFTHLPKPTRRQTTIPRTGIINTGPEIDFHPPRQLKIENLWQGYINNNAIAIYAGTQAQHYLNNPDGKQYGQLHIMHHTSSKTTETRITTPYETGALRIEAVINNRLVLSTAGTHNQPPETLYFDIETTQFVSSPDVVLPTTTPQSIIYP
ncbi:MAG TPA: hypothetical protein VLL52_09185 [Anaerolineae bacterium]|nr:hypothetical protein [Anaerolineae bacterium]